MIVEYIRYKIESERQKEFEDACCSKQGIYCGSTAYNTSTKRENYFKSWEVIELLHSSLADQQIPLVLQVYNAALMQAACPSSGSISYSNLHTGSHTFTFKAIDAAGNSAYDRFSWTIPAATAELIEAD